MNELQKHIAKLREDFMLGELSEGDVHVNPFSQFELWLSQAVTAQIPEVQAMALSTVNENNKPTSRIVYLREFVDGNFWFYGNYNSRKGKNLTHNPYACINFFWPTLERQIRIEGAVTPCDENYSDTYFNNRPRESQLGAWASAQSSELSSRKELEELLEHYRKKFDNQQIPRPPHWGGWVLKANYYEFWQGRKSRLHDRICYSFNQNNWEISRIAP